MSAICPICNKKIGESDDVVYKTIDGQVELVHKVCASQHEDVSQMEAPHEVIKSSNRQLSSTAIVTLDTIATIVIALSMAVGFLVALLGSQYEDINLYVAFLGIFIALGGIVQWAFIKVFTGLAQDIKAIREKIK